MELWKRQIFVVVDNLHFQKNSEHSLSTLQIVAKHWYLTNHLSLISASQDECPAPLHCRYIRARWLTFWIILATKIKSIFFFFSFCLHWRSFYQRHPTIKNVASYFFLQILKSVMFLGVANMIRHVEVTFGKFLM